MTKRDLTYSNGEYFYQGKPITEMQATVLVMGQMRIHGTGSTPAGQKKPHRPHAETNELRDTGAIPSAKPVLGGGK